MNLDELLKLAEVFYLLASELPADSKDTKTVLQCLQDLETYTDRVEYAERNFKHLSSGSSRVVYLTPGNTVVKLAKNDKGVAQNEAEANPKMRSKFLNPIIAHAKNFAWIQTHYLDKITAKEFEKMVGFPFQEFDQAIRFGLKNVSENSDLKKPKNFDKVSKSEIYQEMKRIGQQFKLMPGDLARISSWGTKDGEPVLIDAGLTADVFADFYEDDSSSTS